MSQSNDASMPKWWYEGRELEQAGKLKEMEALLKDRICDQGFALEIARIYRERMLRLRAADDAAGAAEAREQSVSWAYFYASQATSGGEGIALSMERDDFLKTL